MKNKRGFTLPELIFGLVILFILALLAFALIGRVSQQTKVTVAKTRVAQYAALLETVKNDLNYYPPVVSDPPGNDTGTLESLTYSTGPAGYEKGWRGPYLKTTPIDPWGTPYFYRLICEMGSIFGPTMCFRSTPPSYQNFPFTALSGSGTLVMDNFDLTACSVILNGIEIIPEKDFKKDVLHVEKPITLLPGNNVLSVRARSNKSAYILLSITTPNPFSNRTGYVVGSYGKNRVAGGKGVDQDITWQTGQASAEFSPASGG